MHLSTQTHQDAQVESKQRRFKWVNLARLLVPNVLLRVFHKLLIRRDFQRLQKKVPKRGNIQSAAVRWATAPCWCQRSGESGQNALSSQEGNLDTHQSVSDYKTLQTLKHTSDSGPPHCRQLTNKENEATVCTCLPKIGKKVWWVSIFAATFTLQVENLA